MENMIPFLNEEEQNSFSNNTALNEVVERLKK